MRRPIAIALALLLLGVMAAPVQAAAVPQRVFKASFGTSGSGTFTYFTDGSGTMTWALKGLKRSATYKAIVYKGTCGSLGKAVTVVGYAVTNSSGALSKTGALSYTKAKLIWEANWYKVLSLKIVSGTSVKCGTLGFTHVTRVTMARQGVLSAGINLATVRGPSGYPYCNVAMYSGAHAQPAEPINWATFVYGHARTGMFGPIYFYWRDHGKTLKPLIGKTFSLYTSNNRKYTYQIYGWYKGFDMTPTFNTGVGEAWLQTSSGPNYTYPKLFLKGRLISQTTVSYAEAHPVAKPVSCG